MRKIGIVTQNYPDPTQIPSNNHIANLFGGNTAVICRKALPDLDAGRPYFVAQTGVAAGDGLFARLEQARNLLDGYSGRVPVGRNRQGLEVFLRDQDVDAVLAEFGTEGVWIWTLVKRLGLPFFVYFRGYDATAFLANPRHRKGRLRAYQAMLSAADGVFSVSAFLFRALEGQGLNVSRGIVIPSGVDTTLFRPGQKEPGLAVAAGRFIDKKAPDVTIKAFAQAARAHRDARLEMIGDGPLLPQAQALAAELGLGERITFHGRRDHHFVRDRLSAASLFLQHSVTAANGDQEGAPTSIQEAMSSGACVISTRHAGIPDLVVEGETGTLVDEGDVDGFAANIASGLADPQRVISMGEAGRARAMDRFDRGLSDNHIEAAIRGEVLPSWRYFRPQTRS